MNKEILDIINELSKKPTGELALCLAESEAENIELKNRINKAIEYIETHIIEDSEYENYMQCERKEKEELLDILKGDK